MAHEQVVELTRAAKLLAAIDAHGLTLNVFRHKV